MKYTISVLVENHAGVLSRISGLFSRRGYNIDSLAVGVTEDPMVSRMTIVTDGNDYIVEQIVKQLNKLIDVIKVRTLKEDDYFSKDTMLIKIAISPDKRQEIINISSTTNAKIIDNSLSTITLELCDTPYAVTQLQEMLKPYGIIEVVRTGTIAIQKGSESLKI